MENILIIGGSGFVGSNIIEKLLISNHNLFVLSRHKIQEKFIGIPNIKVLKGKINQIEFLKKVIIENKIKIILHLATNLIPSSLKKEFDDEMYNIILPTFKLIDFIAENNLQIIYFSSGGTIYGNSNQQLIESHPLEPINFYGYSKLLIESYIKFMNNQNNLRYLILRPSNIYGRYQKINSKKGFISVALSKILSNEIIEIWGDGQIIRDYIDVDDLVKVLEMLIANKIENNTFNIGCGVGHSLLSVLELLEMNLNLKAKVIFKEKRKVDSSKIILNIEHLKSFINFQPKQLEVGLGEYIKYFLKINNYAK